MNSINSETGASILGEALDSFGVEFLDEGHCREWVISFLFRGGIACPGCGIPVRKSDLRRFWLGKRIKCYNCNKFFTALTGTFFSGTHLDFRKIVILLLFIALGLDNNFIAHRLNCNPETVRLWKKKLS
jgi:transposase-like protein